MSGREEIRPTQPGPLLGEPLAVRDDPAVWARVRAGMAGHGAVLLYARLADWAVEGDDPRAVKEVLGRDWSRYTELSHPDIALRYLASRRLLKSAAAAVVGGSPAALELRYGPTGRPYLRGCDQIDISLSHTDDLLLVGMTTRGLVGVDAERADRRLYDTRLAHHVCTPYELLSLTALPEAERNATLIRLWTLKEAYSKAIGQGLRFRFTEFGFGPDGKPVRVHRPDGKPGTGTEWMFRSFVVDDRYRISIAVYDAGLGTTVDTDLSTMLDPEAAEAISQALAEEDTGDTWDTGDTEDTPTGDAGGADDGAR